MRKIKEEYNDIKEFLDSFEGQFSNLECRVLVLEPFDDSSDFEEPYLLRCPDCTLDCEGDITVAMDFQLTKPTKKQLIGMVDYMIYNLEKHDMVTQPCIMCADVNENYDEKLHLTPEDYVSFPIVSLKEHNGDEILSDIQKKVNSKEELTELEEAFLAFIPFTNLSIPIENAIYEGARLTNEVEIDYYTKQTIKLLQATIVGKIVPPNNQKAIKEVIRMNNDIFKEEFEEAEQKGREIGRLEIIEKMRQHGLDEDMIQKITQ